MNRYSRQHSPPQLIIVSPARTGGIQLKVRVLSGSSETRQLRGVVSFLSPYELDTSEKHQSLGLLIICPTWRNPYGMHLDKVTGSSPVGVTLCPILGCCSLNNLIGMRKGNFDEDIAPKPLFASGKLLENQGRWMT